VKWSGQTIALWFWKPKILGGSDKIQQSETVTDLLLTILSIFQQVAREARR
jgi:hypothetical protein